MSATPPLNPHKWVENYADYLYTYAVSRINDEELARDLVQEVFLAALQRVDKFEGKSSERTWLTAILKNKVVDVYRKRSASATKALAEQGETNFFADDGHWREDTYPREFVAAQQDPLHDKEFNNILQQCMQKLPALWLAVFTMKHLEDQPSNVICSELKLSDANFWVIIHRAKVNLRACLQKNWI